MFFGYLIFQRSSQERGWIRIRDGKFYSRVFRNFINEMGFFHLVGHFFVPHLEKFISMIISISTWNDKVTKYGQRLWYSGRPFDSCSRGHGFDLLQWQSFFLLQQCQQMVANCLFRCPVDWLCNWSNYQRELRWNKTDEEAGSDPSMRLSFRLLDFESGIS